MTTSDWILVVGFVAVSGLLWEANDRLRRIIDLLLHPPGK